MSATSTDLQLALAYRLGETAAPSDSTTINQRLEWINQGYFSVARKRNWWWLEATDTSNTNTGSATGYPEPTDLKSFKELKISNIYYDQIPYEDNREYQGVSAIVSRPFVNRSYKFYNYGGRYYLLPVDASDGATHTIKYFKRVTKVAVGGTFLIPDDYIEVLVAYAEARYWTSITQQAKASLPFQEYDDILKDMVQEQGRRSTGSSGFYIKDPEDAR